MNKLVEIRKSKGHTQHDAAAEMGISFHTVHCAETGKNLPRLTTLEKMSKYYELIPLDIAQIIIAECQKRDRLAKTS